ncbi:anti-sigma factor [Hydrogenophaga sp. 5NK40-0174]|uniref:anti-sigma factor domain-containing protein n=1 Tax=Hydrogenophaga sp. 5NK40-0174 TaxID=3127649 RepID=UPI0031085952
MSNNPNTSSSGDSPSPAPARSGVSAWWRAGTIFLLLAGLLGWAASTSMITQLQAQIDSLEKRLDTVPQVRKVSVLLDDEGLPAILATFDPNEGMLQIQRLNSVKEGREDSMQVWAVATDGQSTRSLGVIESKYKTLQMPVNANDLDGAAALAISVENKGGVAAENGPSLPWLFKGWLVQKSI